jgi:hypothetical protein
LSLLLPASLLANVFMVFIADNPHTQPLEMTSGKKSPFNCFRMWSSYDFRFLVSAALIGCSMELPILDEHRLDTMQMSKNVVLRGCRKPWMSRSALAWSVLFPAIKFLASIDKWPRLGSTAVFPSPKAFSAYLAKMYLMSS